MWFTIKDAEQAAELALRGRDDQVDEVTILPTPEGLSYGLVVTDHWGRRCMVTSTEELQRLRDHLKKVAEQEVLAVASTKVWPGK